MNAVARSLALDEQFCTWWGHYERMSVSPGAAVGLLRMSFEGDVRHVLPVISVPTLVLHRAKDAFVDVRHGRYIAENIRGARYVELEGEDHLPLAGEARKYGRTVVSLGPWTPPPGGYAGGKISYRRIPSAEDFW